MPNLDKARQALWEHPDQRVGRDPVLGAAVEAMDDAAERIAELEAACGSAAEWLERMMPVYDADAYTTDRDREKVQQLIEWLDNLSP